MKIEQTPTNSLNLSNVNAQVKLSPELEQLLTQLKARVGDQLEALVNKVSVITAQDSAELMQTRTATGTALSKSVWQALLTQPEIKLVELKHQQVLFTAITDLPIQKGQTLSLQVSTRGIQLLLTPSDSTANGKPQALTTNAASALLAQGQSTTTNPTTGLNPLVTSSNLIPSPAQSSTPNQTVASPSSQSSIGTATLAGLTATPEDVSNTAPKAATNDPLSPKSGHHSLNTQPLATAPAALIPGRLALEAATPPEQNALTNKAQERATASLLAQAIATALPKADTLQPALTASARLSAVLQQIPLQSLPPALKPLLPLLTQLQQQAVELTSPKPLTAETISKAINNNGVFYERNVLQTLRQNDSPQTNTITDEDIKALLIKTLQVLGIPVGTTPLADPKLNMQNDAIARLWFGLFNGLGGKEKTQKLGVSKQENLLQLVQTSSQNALAKIQLNQFRSLSAGQNDTTQGNSPLHLDIPIKWPDYLGNAHIQIFRPPVEDEEKKEAHKQKHKKMARWRVFMELELGDEGSLSVDLSIADKRVDATFWAEKDELRRKAAAHLQNLRTELTERGLDVADLRCSNNPPPAQKMNLDYAIIDVQT
jgi:Flagellar hook-length control protein FliK